MIRRIVVVLLLCPLGIFSQTKEQSVNQYFSAHNLKVDTAHTPYLYYEVYNWIGAKYRYSGNNQKGIDCSGFATEMYKSVYCIQLTGGSRDIYKQVEPISKKKLQEGDLVFFKIRKGKISHVGVYLANNKFAHATTKTGVTISDLNEPYYKKYFFKGGRMCTIN